MCRSDGRGHAHSRNCACVHHGCHLPQVIIRNQNTLSLAVYVLVLGLICCFPPLRSDVTLEDVEYDLALLKCPEVRATIQRAFNRRNFLRLLHFSADLIPRA